MTDKRLIDANALETEIIKEYFTKDNPSGMLTKKGEEIFNAAIDVARCRVRDAETIDAVEVVHGQWVLGVPITCSVCGKPAAEHDSPISFWESPYCPWCGAKMDGGAEC